MFIKTENNGHDKAVQKQTHSRKRCKKHTHRRKQTRWNYAPISAGRAPPRSSPRSASRSGTTECGGCRRCEALEVVLRVVDREELGPRPGGVVEVAGRVGHVRWQWHRERRTPAARHTSSWQSCRTCAASTCKLLSHKTCTLFSINPLHLTPLSIRFYFSKQLAPNKMHTRTLSATTDPKPIGGQAG